MQVIPDSMRVAVPLLIDMAITIAGDEMPSRPAAAAE